MSASPQDMRTHLDDKFFGQRNRNMVANAGGMEGFLSSPQNIWDMVRTLAESGAPLPRLYFACGDADPIAYEDFTAFRRLAREVGLNASFIEEAGCGHEGSFWDRCLLDAMEKFFPR